MIEGPVTKERVLDEIAHLRFAAAMHPRFMWAVMLIDAADLLDILVSFFDDRLE